MAYRPTPYTNARQERTRATILAAARSVVADAGLEGSVMAEVAAGAGVGVGTLYRYFPSKTDLLCEVMREVCAHELEIVAKVAAGGSGSPTERLVAAVSVFARRALRSGRTAYAMIAEPTAHEVEVLRLRIRADLAQLFAQVVADGVAGGEFPPQTPSISGTALVGAVSEVLVGPLSALAAETDGDEYQGALVDEIVALAVRAVAPYQVEQAPEARGSSGD